MKKKLNVRKWLLKQLKANKSVEIKQKKIENLDKVIKNYYHSIKAKDVRCKIVPGNSKSLWQAVKVSKDLNVSKLPMQCLRVIK